MEAGGKDRPPMLAPDKEVLVTEGSPETTTVRPLKGNVAGARETVAGIEGGEHVWMCECKGNGLVRMRCRETSWPTEQVKSPRPSVLHVETSIPTANPKTAILNPTSNGTHRNRKACFMCKSLEHLIKDCDYHEKKMAQTTDRYHAKKGTHKQYGQMTLPNPQRHVVLTTVLTQSKLVPINAVRPVTIVVSKINVTRPRQAKTVVTKPNLPPRRPINRSSSPKASNFPLKVTVVKAPMVNAAQGVQEKWEWKQKCPILDHVSHNTSTSMTLKRFDYNDALGRSKYIAFGENPKDGKIFRKGKIRIEKLDFDDVYFVKELKFNLFSVLEMCDKKNSVLFTDTECLVLSPEFKLPDENQVLLRVLRKNNMYNNRVLVTKPHIKTLYELLHGRTPSISFMRPFGCLVTILNTIDSLRKFDGKVDEGFLVGYSVSSKAFRVFNSRTRIVQKTLHVNFLENKPNVAGSGPTWLFDIDTLTKTMNYQPVTAGNQSNPSAGIQEQFDAEKAGEENVQQYVLFPVWSSGFTNPQNTNGNDAFDEKEPDINEDNTAGTLVPAVGQLSPNSTNTFSAVGPSNVAASPTHRKSSCIDTSQYPDDPNMPELEDITYSDDEDDVGAEEELLQFKMQKVWILVDLPHGKRAIGHTQEDGIDYEEVFALVARIEAIRLFLAYASFMGFIVYQMDVKSAFLYGTIKEEVYVCQPLGFKDPDYPDKVYKVVKALYGLHKAPRAWYETLASYLLENSFQRGKIDQTLFIKRKKDDILLVQIYIDDIIFGSTDKYLCKAFEKLMKDKFQMSSIRELIFFLGLQVKQKKDRICIS
nr:putative ribonuclease H-like domain-containing protein [Tanacetum cinerariifolium]